MLLKAFITPVSRGPTFFLCVTCALAAPLLAFAQSYPTKPVRFIVPFSPGGGNDIIARMIGQSLAAVWSQQVVIDNRPGADGDIAAEITAKAAPDGYTVFQFNVANAIAVSLHKKIAYDPIRDFAPVTQLAASPFILVVHPSLQARSVEELIALAKAQPGRLNYASGGTGGSSHLVTEMFKTTAAVNIVHIPYNGAGPALTELMAGHVQLMFAVPAAVLGHIKSGRLRPLGVSGAKRSAIVPGIPTIIEAGVQGLEATVWYGVVVPARTPAHIVSRMYTDIVRVLQLPEIRDRMSNQGVDLVGSKPDEFTTYIKSEIVKWTRVVNASGAKLD